MYICLYVGTYNARELAVWYLCVYVCVCGYISPIPMNHVQMLKGQPHRFALWELLPDWYKIFPPDHFGQAKMNDSTMLSNKTSNAWFCAGNPGAFNPSEQIFNMCTER